MKQKKDDKPAAWVAIEIIEKAFVNENNAQIKPRRKLHDEAKRIWRDTQTWKPMIINLGKSKLLIEFRKHVILTEHKENLWPMFYKNAFLLSSWK